jgi:hypothetical protein
MTAEQVTMIVAVAALFLTIIGWIITYISGTKMIKKSLKASMDYEIYKNVLDRTNAILQKISTYTTSLNSHTTNMATVLNEVHSSPEPTAKRFDQLAEQWANETWGIVTTGFEIQKEVLEYMRVLDMSGTDFHSEAIIHKALMTVKLDADEAIQSINNKWVELDLVNTTVKQYERLKKDTQKEITKIDDFSNCLEDTLRHIYNGMIARNTNRPIKFINQVEHRKMITDRGLLDNRLGVNKK